MTGRAISFSVGMMLVGLVGYAAIGGDMPDRDTICRPGYARSVRPPEAVTERIKRQMAAEQGVSPSCCELDHIVPLCLGGPPLSPANLQLQPWPIAKGFDQEEAELCIAVCRGELSLDDARQQIIEDKRR